MANYLVGENMARRLRAWVNDTRVEGNGRGDTTVVDDIRFADPFTVRWSQSCNDGLGMFIVYLPPWAINISGVDVDPSAYLTPVDPDSEDDWYRINNVDIVEGETKVDIYFSVDDYGVISFAKEFYDGAAICVLVAKVEADEETGALSIHQIVKGVQRFNASECFKLVTTYDTEGEKLILLTNCIFRCGGKTYQMDNEDISGLEGGVLCVVLDAVSGDSEPSPRIEVYQNFEALQEAEKDTDNFIIPLYHMSDQHIPLRDLRNAPVAAMGEF